MRKHSKLPVGWSADHFLCDWKHEMVEE